MKLSSFRRKNLKKNMDRIKALNIKTEKEWDDFYDATTFNGKCLYDYGDGHVCAASAALTDKERKSLADYNNDIGLCYIEDNETINNLNHDDYWLLNELQGFHDGTMRKTSYEGFVAEREKFVQYLNLILEE